MTALEETRNGNRTLFRLHILMVPILELPKCGYTTDARCDKIRTQDLSQRYTGLLCTIPTYMPSLLFSVSFRPRIAGQ